MPPVRHWHCLTDIEKGEIIVLSKNISHAEIDKELHIPRTTISSFLQRLKRRHSPYNLPHPGRPRKTSATFDQWLVRTALTETKMPFKELLQIIRGILKRRLLEVWWEIGEEVLNGLMESMPQRVDALVKAEGWYTD